MVWRWGQPAAPLSALLARSGVLAIPTESSYGLAADPRHSTAVDAIYRLKGRGRGKPLPVLAADRGQLAALGVDLDDPGIAVAMSIWPAALTVVAPLATGAALPAAAGGATLAVRIPDHQPLRGLLRALGTALTATSANRAGAPPICDPDRLAELLGPAGVPTAIVDDGVLAGGPPSTLARRTAAGWQVLREGPVTRAALDQASAPVPAGGG